MSPQYDADYNDYSHVVAVGYSLLKSLPAEVGIADQAYLPFIWSAVSDHYGENFGQYAVESGREPVFIAPIAGYTPPFLDLHRGDMLVEFDGKKVSSCIVLKKLLEKMSQKKIVRVGFQKEDGIQFYDVPLLYFRTRLYFSMMGNIPELYCEYVPDKQFFVISKKLVHLIQNDDELAYLMAHDLAHKMKGHKRTKTPDSRTFGYNMVTTGVVAALLLPDYAWLPYESKDERDAAMEAPIYLANAKYDMSRGEKILDRMKPLITDRDTSWFYIHLGEDPGSTKPIATS